MGLATKISQTIAGGVDILPLHLAFSGNQAQVGSYYTTNLVATGGVPPYTFSITVGSLPPGLSLNAGPGTGAGTIAGTPTVAGTYTFTVQVVDSASSIAITACAIVVNGPPTAPYALLLTDTGTRTLDANGTTYATLQVIIQ